MSERERELERERERERVREREREEEEEREIIRHDLSHNAMFDNKYLLMLLISSIELPTATSLIIRPIMVPNIS